MGVTVSRIRRKLIFQQCWILITPRGHIRRPDNEARATPILIDEMIDPVQSENSDEDQKDGHSEAYDPRCNQQEHPREQGSERKQVMGCLEMHP